MSALLQTLQSLEVELHHPGAGCSRARLEQLLHPEFHEIGRSGRAYCRETVIQHLTERAKPPAVVADAFAASELGPGVALLAYRSVQSETGGQRAHHTLRSSIWLCVAGLWQLRYHQGTAAATTW